MGFPSFIVENFLIKEETIVRYLKIVDWTTFISPLSLLAA